MEACYSFRSRRDSTGTCRVRRRANQLTNHKTPDQHSPTLTRLKIYVKATPCTRFSWWAQRGGFDPRCHYFAFGWGWAPVLGWGWAPAAAGARLFEERESSAVMGAGVLRFGPLERSSMHASMFNVAHVTGRAQGARREGRLTPPPAGSICCGYSCCRARARA